MGPFNRHGGRHFYRRWMGDEPWGQGRFFRSGEVPLVLLSLLNEEPAHGYQLMSRLEERLKGAYQPSAGAIYPVLQQLEDQGLIRAEADGGKKVYHITDEGRREVERNQEEINDIWSRTEERSEWGMLRNPDVREVVGPAMRLLKQAVKTTAKSRGDSEVARQVRSVLERAADEIEAISKERKR